MSKSVHTMSDKARELRNRWIKEDPEFYIDLEENEESQQVINALAEVLA